MKPGVGALDDPAPGAKAGLALERLGLLATGADVTGEAKLASELAHLGVVVALVQTEPVRRLRSRLRLLDRDRLDRRPGQLEVVDVRARRFDAERDALTLGEE